MNFRDYISWRYAIILIFVALGIIYFISQGAVGEKEVGAMFLAMVGTIIGALLAFRLNEHRENTKLENERKAALNRALFVVVRQYNAILVLEKNLAKHKTVIEKAFLFPALAPPNYTDLFHDFRELIFLVEVSDPNVVMKLSIEQEGFHQTMESLRVRNNFYVDEIQPSLSKLGFIGRLVPAQEFEAGLGERLFNGAVSGTNTLTSNISESLKSLPEIHDQLFAVAKKLYPKAKFVKLEREP